jgi:hypothetical protein
MAEGLRREISLQESTASTGLLSLGALPSKGGLLSWRGFSPHRGESHAYKRDCSASRTSFFDKQAFDSR